VIAKVQATALRSHEACFGVGFMMATTGFIDDSRTLNQHPSRSTNYCSWFPLLNTQNAPTQVDYFHCDSFDGAGP